MLCATDVRQRCLPDALTVPPALAALTACLWWPALAWGLVWAGFYFFAGRGIGGGDIKLAVPLGIACAAVGGPLGVFAAMGLAGLFTATVAAALKRRTVAHGPSMLGACWAVFLVLCIYFGD